MSSVCILVLADFPPTTTGSEISAIKCDFPENIYIQLSDL